MEKITRVPLMGTYKVDDVIFLLKDLSNTKLEDSTEIREKQIQAGRHYSESLPIEYQPPLEYIQLFWKTLNDYKRQVALYIGAVAEQIYHSKGEKTVLVSLARAGTPIGILIKRYIETRFHIVLPHYSISIIRDRGIDENALKYIISEHPDFKIQFVDGWTGKGAIALELRKACEDFFSKNGILLDSTLAVLADPGCCTPLFGTREDFLIPSACLNSTVSGLISRTVLNEQYIGELDFHGAKFYRELLHMDVSNEYLTIITREFAGIYKDAEILAQENKKTKSEALFIGMEDVKNIQKEFNIDNAHLIKPGVGETTRVLLRRLPWKILMRDPDSPHVRHIVMLANEKGVDVIPYRKLNYQCCGLIKSAKEMPQ